MPTVVLAIQCKEDIRNSVNYIQVTDIFPSNSLHSMDDNRYMVIVTTGNIQWK